jgi:hypothetical protein
MSCKKGGSTLNPFVCILQKSLEKLFSSKKRFPKVLHMKTCFQVFEKCIMQKDFGCKVQNHPKKGF